MKRNRRTTRTQNINALLIIGSAISIVIILTIVFQYDQTVETNQDEPHKRTFLLLNIGIDKADYEEIDSDTLTVYLDEQQVWSGAVTETMNINDSLSTNSDEQDLIVLYSGDKYSQRVNISKHWNYYQISILFEANASSIAPRYSIKNVNFEETGLE